MLKRQSLNVQAYQVLMWHPSARYCTTADTQPGNGSGDFCVNLSEADVEESNGVIPLHGRERRNTQLLRETAEKIQKPESAISWIERSATLQVIADTIPVTKQAYRSLGFVAGEIDRLLRKASASAGISGFMTVMATAPNIKLHLYLRHRPATLANLPNYQGLTDPEPVRFDCQPGGLHQATVTNQQESRA